MPVFSSAEEIASIGERRDPAVTLWTRVPTDVIEVRFDQHPKPHFISISPSAFHDTGVVESGPLVFRSPDSTGWARLTPDTIR